MGLSLRSGRNCRWGEWITSALSPPSIPRLRCPWARHRTPNCSPGAAALAAHSGCVFTVCVCVHCCVCAHLDGLNAEHKFPSMGHHTWPHVTSLLFTSLIICQVPHKTSFLFQKLSFSAGSAWRHVKIYHNLFKASC